MFVFNHHRIPFAKSFHEKQGIDEYQNDPDVKCWAEDWHTEQLHNHLADGIGDILEWFMRHGLERYLHDKKFLGEAAKSNRKNGKREWAKKPANHNFRHHYKKDDRTRQNEQYQNIFKQWFPKENFDYYEVGKNWTIAEVLASTSKKVNVIDAKNNLLHHNLRELTRWNQMIEHCNRSDRLKDSYGNPFDADAYKISLQQEYQKNRSDEEWYNILPEELKENFVKGQQSNL